MSVPPPLPQAPRNPILTFFAGLWSVVNFTRRLILNLLVFGLLFLFLIGLVAVVGGAGNKVGPLHDRTTLVLAPQGALVEQFSTDPATRALAKALGDNGSDEVQLRDLLRVIEAAKNDAKIERVLLDVDALQPSGLASLREVAAALGDLRASGKQVVAFSEGMGQSAYLLAAQASELYLDPLGGITLTGLSSSRPYFREALQEKLGIDMHLFRVGEYKSAAEPYIRDAASAEAREADLYWMNDLWQRYVQEVAAARKLDAGQLSAAIDDLPAQVAAAGGDLAKLALAQKLVDGLKTRREVEALLAERGVADGDSAHGFRSIELQDYLLQLDARQRVIDNRPQVAVVVASGAITSGEQPAGSIGGVSTAKLLQAAREDEDVKAVVLRVDSPGGEVFPSEQIRREVLALKQAGKPVVVSMGDVAASGGYWISASADRIYADASTISGSIGIYGLIPNVARALDKIGVHTDGVSTTRWAGAFDVTRPLDPQVGQVWQSMLDKGYADFLATVSEGRGKTTEEVDAVARGRVWSGAQAQQRGLVDELGGLQAALADAAARAGFKDADAYQVRYIERSGSPFEQFLGSLAGSRLGAAWLNESDFARLLLRQALPGADAQLQAIERSIKDGPKPMAHCFCGL